MVTTELGACEWFVWDLRRSNLIDRGQLDQVVHEFLSKHPGAEPPALSAYLVSQGILTDFQAERLLQGKTQGFVLGPYTLMDALGTGSMGTVYKAQNKNDNLWYAVKVLPRRSMWNVRLARRKVRAFEQCQHAAVVPFVDVGTSGGMHYLAWPFVEGEPLDKLADRLKKLPPGLAANLVMQAADGLAATHGQGLFHGLLKPSNLLLGADGQLRILDFGIGCLLVETEGESLVDTMSTANSVASGLDCASPESIMDPTNLTPTGDQYSLGCTLYYFLTGQYPFPDGTAVEKMMAHQVKAPPAVRELNPAISEELAEVVNRLMEKAPQSRYGGMEEVVNALRPLADAAVTLPKAGKESTKAESRKAALGETPKPSQREKPTTSARVGQAGVNLPNRQSLRGGTSATSPTPAPAKALERVTAPEKAPTSEKATAPEKVTAEKATKKSRRVVEEKPRRSWALWLTIAGILLGAAAGVAATILMRHKLF